MSLDQALSNTIRGLVIDGVHYAKSGHPGGAMSSADFISVLYREFLQFDPENPNFLGRDRFVLSAGHESMLLYSMLFLNGWLETKDLQNFRKLHSKTPGHPENYLTPGVECTTGPLGQGAAMSVGMAWAQTHLAHTLDPELFKNFTYALLGDGCMQEDVTLGAASLAGHWGLNNLIWYYDKNACQISGPISRATSDDERKIFEGFGWSVKEISGHNFSEIRDALHWAKSQNKPTLIIGTSTMAKGAATMEGDHETHGAPLPAEERNKTKIALGLQAEKDFFCDPKVLDYYKEFFPKKSSQVKTWNEKLNSLTTKDQNFAKLWKQYFQTPISQTSSLLPWKTWDLSKAQASRNTFGELLKHAAEFLPNLVGGSADLEPSNMTGAFAKMVKDFQKDFRKGKNLNFGVREFPMSAIANGIALHGGLIPFDATFLSFSDYARPALRLGAIQKIRVLHEYTHDSFYLGEDGPTHQPVEHVASLRAIPDLYVMRPADIIETEVMFRCALDLNFPTAICLTRQKLENLADSPVRRELIAKGAYTVHADENAKIIFFATGSEVSLAMKAAKLNGEAFILISIPCWEIFFKQETSYQQKILNKHIHKRVSVEAGSHMGWHRFVGADGLCISLDRYGDSAPMEALEKEYGFTPEAIVARIKDHNFPV